GCCMLIKFLHSIEIFISKRSWGDGYIRFLQLLKIKRSTDVNILLLQLILNRRIRIVNYPIIGCFLLFQKHKHKINIEDKEAEDKQCFDVTPLHPYCPPLVDSICLLSTSISCHLSRYVTYHARLNVTICELSSKDSR